MPLTPRVDAAAARNVVATTQPLAVQSGLAMLQRGGSAVDAALAAAITLTVVEPCSNGIGSDLFAIIWDAKTQKLHGLNASGRSPYAANRDLGALMKLGGWKSERMVLRYAHVNVGELAASIEALPWRKSGKCKTKESKKRRKSA